MNVVDEHRTSRRRADRCVAHSANSGRTAKARSAHCFALPSPTLINCITRQRRHDRSWIPSQSRSTALASPHHEAQEPYFTQFAHQAAMLNRPVRRYIVDNTSAQLAPSPRPITWRHPDSRASRRCACAGRRAPSLLASSFRTPDYRCPDLGTFGACRRQA